ncbi:hypothetical protein GLO73106DRAFT_00001710 [Gloeocapsa sp. PCC 73106]|nr:hypothetical protein GLO73106DRAFT_00001710 [Gloeocapsa sp. PCC 73106]
MQKLPVRIFLISLFMVSLTWSIATVSENSKIELRGVWLTNIDSEVLLQQNIMGNAINTLAQLNFNTLYPTVWNSGYTLYPSQIALKTTGIALDPTPELQNRDILEEIIEHGHFRKMRVIPWFEFGFMAPIDSNLAQNHPEWLTQRLNGDTIWLEGNIHRRVWLNPLHPEVQNFITDLAIEIVSNYEVDGLQFDDHFGYPADFGYDNFTVELYKQEHGGKIPPTDYQDPSWIQWRAQKLTGYMQNLFKSIKAANPQVLISLSPNPQQFSLNQYLLDWATWERMGLIEELVLQLYRNNLSDFVGELNQPEVQRARSHIPVSIGILAGLKGRPISFAQIQAQVEAVRQQGFAGVSLFFYESLWNLAPEAPKERIQSFRTLFLQQIMIP